MTREEAINTIQELMKACVPNSNYYMVGEMAIKALEKEHNTLSNSEKPNKSEISTSSTTKNDLGVDAVSRQAVLDLIADYDLSMGEVVRGIHALPPVTPIRPKGHWELVQRGKLIDICCSNCEAVRIKEYAYNYTIDQLNKEDLKECFECADMRYCPNCGADMREVEE